MSRCKANVQRSQDCIDDGCPGTQLVCFGPRGEGGCGDSIPCSDGHDARKMQPCMVCPDGILGADPCEHVPDAVARTLGGMQPGDWDQVRAYIQREPRWIHFLPLRAPHA